MKIEVGKKAPDFSGDTQNGKTVSLSDYTGKKLIIFFYPKDNTPGCTAEACNLRDNYSLLKEKGFEIIGVSADSVKKHENFASKHELPFPLIADTEHKMINDYKVWGLKKFMGREYDGIHRTTYIIDENGTISHRFDKVKTKEHTAQILEEVE